MADATISWRTNSFRVLDAEKLEGASVFPDCDLWKNDQGRIQLSAWDQSNDCFLISDFNDIDASSIEFAGGIPNRSLSSYNAAEDRFEDLYGFDLLDAFLPEGEIVIAVAIDHLDGDLSGSAYAWRKGMEVPLKVKTWDIFDLVEAKLEVSRNDIDW